MVDGPGDKVGVKAVCHAKTRHHLLLKRKWRGNIER